MHAFVRFGGSSAVVTFLISSILLSACSGGDPVNTTDSVQRPAHHTDDGFRNLYIEDPDKTFFSFVKMRLFGDTKWADHENLADEVPVQPLPPALLSEPYEGTRVSWLGHSSLLLQRDGVNILTDPIFSDRASPLSFAGPKRYVDHVIDYAELPPIDYVVISHNHYDHLDELAIEELSKRKDAVTRFMVPLGLREWMIDAGVDPARVIEMDWWDETASGTVRIQALPSQHWSARSVFDRMETLWASWLIEVDGFSIWFGGDTGYNDVQFREISDNVTPIQLALIPIGAYSPRWFMKDYHVNPEEAVRIHQDLRARTSIGIHWGTFPLTAEPPTEPPEKLSQARTAAGLSEADFSTMAIGESVIVAD